jgi:hypothetical protein
MRREQLRDVDIGGKMLKNSVELKLSLKASPSSVSLEIARIL